MTDTRAGSHAGRALSSAGNAAWQQSGNWCMLAGFRFWRMERVTMRRFAGVLLDLGGVVYAPSGPLPGSREAIARLRGEGLPVRFLTNTTRTPHAELVGKLRAMGLDVKDEELFTPAMAACRILGAEGLSPHLLVHPALQADFAEVPEAAGRAVVIGDAAGAFTYDALNSAFRTLQDGAEFLALADNRAFRDADGKLSLDAGPFVAALEFASRRKARVLGKPAREFFMAAIASMGCGPDGAVMVGDDVESDVGGALAAGLAGVLVRTGKYEPGAENLIDPAPCAVVDDLAAAAEWIVSAQDGD